LQEDNYFADSIVKKCIKKTLKAPAFSLPWHNYGSQLPAKLPDELLHAPFIWLHHGGIVPPLHHPYDSPYTFLQRGPCSFTIRVGLRDEIISVSRLKACMEADAMPGSL
jgi:hypothetical protein